MILLFRLILCFLIAGYCGGVLAADRKVGTMEELITALSTTAVPGDTILLEEGTYQITTWALAVNTSNLTIRGLSGIRENVIVQGQGMTTGSVNHGFFVAAHHVTIQDLTIQNVRNHGIQTDVNIDYLHVNNCIFRDTYEQMLKVPYDTGVSDPSEDGLIENCLFEYTEGIGPNWYIGGIDVHFGKDWIVRKNIFKNIQSPGGHIAEHAIHFWTRSQGTLAEQNLIINCDRGIGFGLESSPHFDGIIRNNMIYHDGSGEFPDVGIALESSSDTQIYNNTVILNHTLHPNAIEYRFSDTIRTHIANNVTNKLITSRDGGTATVESNLTSARLSWFVNPSAGDLHLAHKIKSVVNQGIVITGLTNDFDGDRRPLQGGIDLGADEFRTANTVPQNFLLLIP